MKVKRRNAKQVAALVAIFPQERTIMEVHRLLCHTYEQQGHEMAETAGIGCTGKWKPCEDTDRAKPTGSYDQGRRRIPLRDADYIVVGGSSLDRRCMRTLEERAMRLF